MKLHIGLEILATFILTVGAFEYRIIGGKNAPNNKYPYQASMQIFGRHQCGGSVLNKRWILTAGHCTRIFNQSPILANYLNVVLGTNLVSGRDGKIYYPDFVVTNEEFLTKAPDLRKNRLVIGDIGLLHLNKDIIFDDKIQPIQLPSEDIPFTQQVKNPVATLTGWGRQSIKNKGTAKILQEIQLNVLTKKKCELFWNGHKVPILDSHICTLNEDGNACEGDSGGPLVYDGAQIGIVSFGGPCGSHIPDVYTKVYSYVSWINNTINDYEKNI